MKKEERERCVICNDFLDHKKPKQCHWIHIKWVLKNESQIVEKSIPICSIICASTFWHGSRWLPYWEELKELLQNDSELHEDG